jgi:transcription elongation factor GreA
MVIWNPDSIHPKAGREVTLAMEKVPMTAAGHQALESELKRLIAFERPRIIELIAEARGHDDLSENAEYHAAKEAHGLNEERIAELEDKLSRAEVIDVSKLTLTCRRLCTCARLGAP